MVSGEVIDVAVDIRKSLDTFGQWVSVSLFAENKKQFWVPPGFAHGFVVLSQTAEFLYKTTDYYVPEFERCIRWDDSDLSIDWHCADEPLVSDKDAKGLSFKEADLFE